MRRARMPNRSLRIWGNLLLSAVLLSVYATSADVAHTGTDQSAQATQVSSSVYRGFAALCAVAKNENRYVREWVDHHKCLGACCKGRSWRQSPGSSQGRGACRTHTLCLWGRASLRTCMKGGSGHIARAVESAPLQRLCSHRGTCRFLPHLPVRPRQSGAHVQPAGGPHRQWLCECTAA